MDTLVLSRTWEPDRIITWQDAMSLFFAGRVEIIEEYEDRFVRSVSVKFNMPCVVRFVSGIRFRNGKLKFSRQNVYARDKGECQYCGIDVPRHESTFDHVIPRCMGGKTTWDNIVISCLPCNQRKGGRTPKQARMALRNKPVRPKRLTDIDRIRFDKSKDIPVQWKDYVPSLRYWNVELENDNV